jgi:putative DNA primase/helicase
MPPQTVPQDSYGEALAQIQDYGLELDALDASGTLHRVRHRDDKQGRKDGWYVAHEFVASTGQVIIAGAYGWWKDQGGPYRIRMRAVGLSQAERQALQRRRREVEAAAKRARQNKAREAARRAAEIWQACPEMGASDYLQAKRVRAFGLRFSRGTVVVPMRGAGGRLVGLQFIDGDGAKRFLTGTAKQGSFHLIGLPEPGGVLALAEGYATAASVHLATGWPCAAAFDAGNLEPVAKALSATYPGCRFVVCGDDDHATQGNPGRAMALRAAESVRGIALFPHFAGEPGTDWNDLSVREGADTVKRQLEHGIAEHDGSEPPSPPGGGGSETGFGFDLGVLLAYFTVIYTTETVYDGRYGRILPLSSLRVAAGKSLVRIWLEHPCRRMVTPEDVVFDPSLPIPALRRVSGDDPADPQHGKVNLFRGMPHLPKEGRCARLLELLYYLCGESDNVFDWVLKWTAYPLQHLGAKMRTAIIMHGPEGTGKNTFWGAVREIYGEYGCQISQNELESQFNGWSSRKLFVIGNEVVSRKEMYHQKGRLKNMITEPEWAINEKMLPVRMEANHANFVFFSNTIQPATPDADDRRYLVIWTPPKLDDAFYREVGREIDAGAVQALYHYLLQYDIGDFDEHAKPIMTDAKQDLIETSMRSQESFYKAWIAGELPVAFQPCLHTDLYWAYRKWCDRYGERFVGSEIEFRTQLKKRPDR